MKKLALIPFAVSTVACVSSGKYDSLAQQYKQCQEQCATERDAGNARVAELEKQLADAKAASEAERADLEGKFGATQKELEELRRQNAETQKRLAAFRALTAKFQKMIGAGAIKVGFRNGLMIMQLPAGILFASGRADLSDEGEVALTEVAGVLAELKDRRFLIAGHTDNVPVSGRKYKDNWELSLARAMTVSRWLMAQGVAPTQIGAAGYAEFDPVMSNDTEEGKQQNRRIEIVVMPNIDELPRLPEESTASN